MNQQKIWQNESELGEAHLTGGQERKNTEEQQERKTCGGMHVRRPASHS